MSRAHPFKVKLFAAGIFAIVLFRAFTEPILFPTLFDFFYFGASFALSHDPRPSTARAVETD